MNDKLPTWIIAVVAILCATGAFLRYERDYYYIRHRAIALCEQHGRMVSIVSDSSVQCDLSYQGNAPTWTTFDNSGTATSATTFPVIISGAK